jgi:hypothetical protein
MRHLQAVVSGRPQLGEFADHEQDDIDYVAGDDAVAALERQRDEVLALLGTLDDERIAGLTYAGEVDAQGGHRTPLR